MDDARDPPAQLAESDFIRLLVKHESALRAFARSILSDQNLVDDALQEASVTMWQKLGQLRDEEGFLPWSKVILRFKCLSVAAANRRHHNVLSDKVLELLADEAEAVNVEDMSSIRSALASCLTEFSAAHQELLLAPYSGDGRVIQLAEECGKTVNALYKLLGRLRGKLGVCVRVRLQSELR